MTEFKKYYQKDQHKIKVKCPCCRKLISGWTFHRDWWVSGYWIAHIRPNKKGNECWANDEQMKRVKREWEEKYELVTEES